ncbi:MAG: hypothetical protein NXH85_06160 [Pseudomonadaceae bacterium]|nr:hypothetical protein [Pseudomonadaceae bacterium]
MIAPYHHPTTVVFADDNQRYLKSLLLRLPNDLSYHAFTSAEPAEEFLRSQQNLPSLPSRCVRPSLNADNQPTLTFDLNQVEQEINDPRRFARLSVAVIDYAMPNVDGIELCRRIKDLDIKKLLLTGVADEKTAVAAFNEGIIDRYVRKGHGDPLNDCLSHIYDLADDYFDQYTKQLSAAIQRHPPKFLEQEIINTHISDILNQRAAVEHYLVGDPPGFLSLDAQGRFSRIIVASKRERNEQLVYAEKHGAPRALRRLLKAGKAVGFFAEPVETYFGEAYPWDDNIVPATALDSGEWSVAVVDNPPMDVDFSSERCSYEAYRRSTELTPPDSR